MTISTAKPKRKKIASTEAKTIESIAVNLASNSQIESDYINAKEPSNPQKRHRTPKQVKEKPSLEQQIKLLKNELKTCRKQLAEQTLEIERLKASEEAVADANIQMAGLYMELEEQHTKVIELNEALTEAKDQIVQSEKLASLGQLVAGVAHEINTPIGVAVSAGSTLVLMSKTFKEKLDTATLKKSDLFEFAKDAVETTELILSNLNRAASLVQSFKKVAVNQTNEVKQTFNLKEYLEDVVRSLGPEFKKAKVTCRVSGQETIVMDSFPSPLSQVVINLCQNAIKHAFDSPDITDRRIDIEFEVVEEDVRLYFKDNGKGIPSNILPLIFDPFFTTKRGAGGSGLGLNIVFNIITQQLQGTIRVESVVGEGTTFIIHIPIVTK